MRTTITRQTKTLALRFTLVALAAPAMSQQVVLHSRIETRREPGEGLEFRVEWIEWNSGFRGTGLEVGDVVLGVNGAPYGPRTLPGHCIGQPSEGQGFAELGLQVDGSALSLLVLREGERLEFTGKLSGGTPGSYRSPDGQRMLSPDGPCFGARDGFDYTWSAWYRNFRDEASGYLAHGMDLRTDSRTVFERNEQHKARVAHLIQNYDGPFARAVLSDWKRVRGIFAGELRELSEADLAYRSFGGAIVEEIDQAGRAARAELVAARAEEFIDTFPALDPTRADVATVAGRIVRVDQITRRDIQSVDGDLHLVLGDRAKGHYLVAAEDSVALVQAMEAYQRAISDELRDVVTVFGVIGDEPVAGTIGGLEVHALQLHLIGAQVGGPGFFLDFENRDEGGRPRIVGTEAVVLRTVEPLSGDATPAEVMAALVQYVKLGDRKAWEALFADWRVDYRGELTTGVSLSRHDLDRVWSGSRTSLFDDVYDVTVARVDEPEVVSGRRLDAQPSHVDSVLGLDDDEEELEDRAAEAAEFPLVEEVTARLDFVGRFGEEYRTFTKFRHTRTWKLQRVNGGAWRIVSPGAL